MGKIKKLRQKYHASLKKSKSLNNLPEYTDKKGELHSEKKFFKSNENIFAGINISLDELTKSLPENFDTHSVISTKSRKELKEEERHMKKKDRQKLRRDRFLQKLESSYQALHNSKLKKRSQRQKQKKPYNNMHSLLDALPTLESITNEAAKKKSDKLKQKPKGILKAKNRLKQQEFDSKLFKSILCNKKFKADPFGTITEFLKQKVSHDT